MQPYWDALKNLINSHTLAAGIILGIIVGFIPSVLAGQFGNIYTEKRKKRTLEGKQSRFVDELTSVTRDYVNSPPTDETEVTQRRERVAQNVKTLSLKIFNQDTPIAESIRPDNTEYPKLPTNSSSHNVGCATSLRSDRAYLGRPCMPIQKSKGRPHSMSHLQL